MPASRYAVIGKERHNGTLQGWNMPSRGRKNAEGFGFVVIDGKEQNKSTDLFLYADSIVDAKLRSQAKLFGLKQGLRVSFLIEEPMAHHESGKAVDVRPLDGDGGGGGGRGRDRSPRRRSPSRRRRSPSRRKSPSPRRSRKSPSVRRRSPSRSRSRSGKKASRSRRRSPSPKRSRSTSRRRSPSGRRRSPSGRRRSSRSRSRS